MNLIGGCAAQWKEEVILYDRTAHCTTIQHKASASADDVDQPARQCPEIAQNHTYTCYHRGAKVLGLSSMCDATQMYGQMFYIDRVEHTDTLKSGHPLTIRASQICHIELSIQDAYA